MGLRKRGDLGIVERIQNKQLIETVSGDYPGVVPSRDVYVDGTKDLIGTQPNVYASIVHLPSEAPTRKGSNGSPHPTNR
jgi:hypothetical protein